MTNLTLNNNLDLLYNYPDDKFYPSNNLIIQLNTMFPVNKQFSIGPSFFNDSYFKLYKDSINTGTILNFNSIIMSGINFIFTPYHPKLKIPFMLAMIDFGFSCEINNNESDGDGFTAKIGGYSTQLLVFPLMPINLFIMDVNIVSVMSVKTPGGNMPGIMDRNILLVKFKFTDFFNKKIGLGLRLKNNFNYTLTGKPDLYNLASQYTYDRIETSFYYGGIKGLEIHTGYGFEYITFARDPLYFIAHKLVNEISWKFSFFKFVASYYLSFWDNKLQNMNPSHKFELNISFSNMDI